MSQQRLFEFEAPDSTFDINSRFVSIAPSGLHAGFNVVLGGTMDLELNHLSTGKTYVNQDLTLTPKQGLVITKQGVEVRVSNAITLPIAPTTTQGRRDAVILSHSYQSITEGVAATISVLQDIGVGEPSLSTNQVLLGILGLPQNCTALNQSGVVYDRRQVPNITDLSNLVAPLQSQIDAKIPLAQKAQANGVATLDNTGKVPIAQLPEEFNKTKVVADITERDALVVWEGRKAHVIDATADTSVESGSAGYIWNGAAWIKIYEGESLDLDFSNYYTKPETDDLLFFKADKDQGAFTQLTNIGSNYSFVPGFPSFIEGRQTQWGVRHIKGFAIRSNVDNHQQTIIILPLTLRKLSGGFTKILPIQNIQGNTLRFGTFSIGTGIIPLQPLASTEIIYFDEMMYI